MRTYTVHWITANGKSYNFKTTLRSVALAMFRDMSAAGHLSVALSN
jgi:predicted aspartyl protease